MSPSRLDYLIRYSQQVARLADFYRHVFDFPQKLVRFEGQYIELDAGGITLALCGIGLRQSLLPELASSSDPTAPTPPVPANSVQLSIQVDNVSEYYARAIASGGLSIAPPQLRPWHCEVAIVRDPDGALIEICCRLDQ